MLTQNFATLLPAYGRDYTTKAGAVSDFLAGKDFLLTNDARLTYINREQIAPGTKVNIRFANARRVTVVGA